MPDVLNARDIGYFGFHLFLPDYSGYNKVNWRNKLDPNLIQILQVKAIDKGEAPAGYGDPKAQFSNARRLLEESASLHAYGLQGYRPKYSNVEVTWVGNRSNGEFIFFHCDLAPGDAPRAGLPNPQCDVRYYSESEQLFVAYRYSNSQLHLWKQIDDAIWSKLNTWRVKQ
jgi:hypothetical protein